MLFPADTITSTNAEYMSTLEFELGPSDQIDFDNLKFAYFRLEGNDKLQLSGGGTEVAVIGRSLYVDNKKTNQKINVKNASRTKVRLLKK